MGAVDIRLCPAWLTVVVEVEKKCNEKGTFFFFTNWWKHAMMSLLYMPVELYVQLSVPSVHSDVEVAVGRLGPQALRTHIRLRSRGSGMPCTAGAPMSTPSRAWPYG